MNKKATVVVTIIIAVFAGFFWFGKKANELPANNTARIENNILRDSNGSIYSSSTPTPRTMEIRDNQKKTIASPINNALERITKKPFGIKVSPKNSPVNPEHFSGYHTGVDFEAFENEQNVDVSIYAICNGPLVLKKTASGYGGVIVQKCEINKEAVTVIYGHMKLLSIAKDPGDDFSAGEKIGLLGKGYSEETGGERKHLHLSIRKGTAINILGYAQSEKILAGWINIKDLLL